MKKSIVIILSIFLLTAVVALSGCTSQQATNTTATPSATVSTVQYPVTVTDDYNRTATFSQEPQRIISLSSENTEIIYALGLGDRVVGDNDYDDYPAAAVNMTKVGGITNVNVEKVASLNPDVIFANTLNPRDTVEKLDSMGYKTVVNNITDIPGIENAILRVGKVCNASDNATIIVNNIKAKQKAVTDKTSSLNDSQRPSVLLLTGYMPGEPFYVFGADTYGDSLIKMAGGVNAASNVSGYGVMSNEAIIKANPDIIIVPVDGFMTTEKDFKDFKAGNESWMKGMKAMDSGHIYEVDGDTVNRAGPRVVNAMDALSKAIHPELFQ